MLGAQVGSSSKDAVSVDAAANILHGVVRSFVASPDVVRVGTAIAGDGTLFTVRVAPDDLATVCGPAHRTLRSLQTLAMALGRRSGQRFALDCEAAGGISS